MDISTHPPQQASILPPTSMEGVAASEREKMSAGTKRDKLPSTSSGTLTPSGEKCRSLETVISRLEMLNVGKKTLDIPALLLTTLDEMNSDELRRFQSYLIIGRMLGFPPIPESQLENTDRQNTVDQMVKRYGPEGAVRITLGILRGMDRDDVAEKLQRDHTRVLLLTSLQELTEDQLKKFQSYLTSGRIFGFPLIPERQLENTDRQDTVDQMVESYGPEGAVRNTGRILREMDRDDLAEKLERDHTRATTWWRDSDSDKWRRRKEHKAMRKRKEKRSFMLDVPALLLTGLEELTEEQLTTFQFYLTTVQLLGLPPIPESQLENTDRQNTVDQMVKRYNPEGAVRNTLKILREMDLDDLAEKLQRDHTRAWLLNSLEELNINELKTFQNYLNSGKLLGFPPMPKSQLENTDRQVTVDLMMKIYDPERAVKITLRILRCMNDHDLTEKLQSDHTGL
uniref:Pyrin domain-containing protein n=2 Tax=Oncorhynchus tshawytscha TaxID=74940 RepID=A0AAZ3SFE4_ONCTS